MAKKLNIKMDVCSICIEIFSKPKLLSCSHSFCEDCLDEYVTKFKKDNKFPCPLCRSGISIPEGGVSKLSNNYYISGQGKQTSTTDMDDFKICGFCDINKSKLKCSDCDRVLCSNCKLCHDVFVPNHTVVDITTIEDSDTTDNSGNQCLEHSLSRDIYCKACSICICSKCYMSSHFGHKYSDLSSEELRTTTKQELNSLKTKIKSQLDVYIKASSHYDSLISDLPTMVLDMFNKIDIQSTKLCNEVNNSAEELKKNINFWLEEENNKLKLKKQKIDIKKHVVEVQNIKLNKFLEEQSFVQMLPQLHKLRQEVFKFCKTPQEQLIPVLRSSSFLEGEINSSILKTQIGHFRIQELSGHKIQELSVNNLQEPLKHDLKEPSQFNKQEAPELPAFELIKGQVYDFTTVYNHKDVVADSKLHYIKCKDSPWQVAVYKYYNRQIEFYIKPDGDYINDVIFITLDASVKLINLIDDTKSVEKTVGPVKLGFNRCAVIKFQTNDTNITDQDNGYLYFNGDFRVHIRINITELVKY